MCFFSNMTTFYWSWYTTNMTRKSASAQTSLWAQKQYDHESRRPTATDIVSDFNIYSSDEIITTNIWWNICPFAIQLSSSSSSSSSSSLGPTVFCEPRNFEPSRGIWPFRGISVFPQNFTESHVNTEILRQRPNSVSLYCCCNCDTQSLRTAAQACWFQWRVFTFSLLTYLSFYLLDLCTRRRLVIHESVSKVYNWAKVGTVQSILGGRSELQNSKNLPHWAVEFGKRRRGIWQNLPRKTVGPNHHHHHHQMSATLQFSGKMTASALSSLPCGANSTGCLDTHERGNLV